jgi:hypothetical protein
MLRPVHCSRSLWLLVSPSLVLLSRWCLCIRECSCQHCPLCTHGVQQIAHSDLQVALHFARELLRQRPAWERPEFMAAWQDALPEVTSCRACLGYVMSGSPLLLTAAQCTTALHINTDLCCRASRQTRARYVASR